MISNADFPEGFDADTGRDLLILRDRFQRERLGERVILDHVDSPQGPMCVNGCGNLLTIEDRYSQCRQCILGGQF